MFNRFTLSPSGVKIYETAEDNVPGVRLHDKSAPHVQDLFRKLKERGRSNLQSENSEDAISWATLSAWARLPPLSRNRWMIDFLRVAATEAFAQSCAPYVDRAQLRFWVEYPAPECLQSWLRKRLMVEGEGALKHLDASALARVRPRLEKILRNDPDELPERHSEVDIELRFGNHALIHIEAKLYSDISSSTFSSGRTQLLRGMELVNDVAAREGFKEARFILLTMERNGKLHPEALRIMKRYRGSDMRRLRQWDEVGAWDRLKKDMPHRASEPDAYFMRLSQRVGWATFPECWKLTMDNS